MFKRVIGKTCESPDCKVYKVVVDPSLNVCEECATPLTEMTVLNRPVAAAAAALGALTLVGGLYFGTAMAKAYFVSKAAEAGGEAIEHVANRLDDTARQKVKQLIRDIQLGGDTSEEAARQLEQFRREHKVDPGQIEAITHEVEAERATDHLSRSSDRAVTALLRDVYADGIKTSEEQEKLDAVLRERPSEASRLAEQEQEIKERVASSQSSLKQGMVYAAQGTYSQAVKEFRHSAEVDPENAYAWANLSEAYQHVNDYDGAQAASDRALQIDSSNWFAHFSLGRLHALRGQRDKAIQELTEALRLVEQAMNARITRAEVIEQMAADEGLASVRSDPRYRQLVAAK
jgi:tetratricopeptide (TPR) repeat protein